MHGDETPIGQTRPSLYDCRHYGQRTYFRQIAERRMAADASHHRRRRILVRVSSRQNPRAGGSLPVSALVYFSSASGNTTRFVEGCRLDELPQVFDLISGDMSFVGTRPEAVKYVEKYKPEYMATLLLPAGITSEASIRYKDEAELLDGAEDVDKVYIEEVLPGKMRYNLESIKRFSFVGEIVTMFRTVFAVLGKDYE